MTKPLMMTEGEITKLERSGKGVVFVTFSILLGEIWIPVEIPVRRESTVDLAIGATIYLTLETK